MASSSTLRSSEERDVSTWNRAKKEKEKIVLRTAKVMPRAFIVSWLLVEVAPMSARKLPRNAQPSSFTVFSSIDAKASQDDDTSCCAIHVYNSSATLSR